MVTESGVLARERPSNDHYRYFVSQLLATIVVVPPQIICTVIRQRQNTIEKSGLLARHWETAHLEPVARTPTHACDIHSLFNLTLVIVLLLDRTIVSAIGWSTHAVNLFNKDRNRPGRTIKAIYVKSAGPWTVRQVRYGARAWSGALAGGWGAGWTTSGHHEVGRDRCRNGFISELLDRIKSSCHHILI